MNRCKTCKHWQPLQNYGFNNPEGSRECTAAMPVWEVVDDTFNEYKKYTLKPEHSAVLSMVADGSAYMAALITMPDFGCVLHQPGDDA